MAAEPVITPVDRQVEILVPGQDFVWQVKDDSAVAGTIATWQISGWNNEQLSQPVPLVFNHGKAQIRYTPMNRGWQELVVIERNAAGATISETRRSFVSGETRKPGPDDFKYGVTSHLTRVPEFFLPEIEAIDKLGIGYVRDEVSWYNLQPTPGQWNWARFDPMIDGLNKIHVQPQITFDYGNKWAGVESTAIDSTKPKASDPTHVAIHTIPRLQPWLAYVRATVDRYKDRVHYWEIWNEQDGNFWDSPVDGYIKLFDETSKAIKQTDPHAFVMNGGFSMHGMPSDTGFNDEFLAKADRTYWDILAYHDYQSFSDELIRRKWVADWCAKYHVKLPLWMNEGGISAVKNFTPRIQADTLTKRLAAAPALGLDAYILYDLKNDGPDPKVKESNFGLLNFDCTPKPSFAAYQNLIHLLGGRKYLKTEKIDNSNGSTLWELLYAGRTPSDDQVAVLWIDKSDTYDSSPTHMKTTSVPVPELHENDPIAMTVKFARLDNVTLLDLMGNPLPHQSSPAATTLTITNEPVYLLAKPTGDWNPKEIPTVTSQATFQKETPPLRR